MSAAQLAALQSEVDQVVVAANDAWLILNGVLVFFMQVGFAMLEAGTVRKQFSFNILFNNLLDVCVVAIVWYICGFAFAFGDGDSDNGFIGNKYFACDSLPSATQTNAFWFYQFAFAAVAATIVSGAAAERLRWQAYIIFVAFFAAWIYPVVAHWVWATDGWLNAGGHNALWGVGVMDFAGSGVVHIVGGTSALVAAIVCGYRGQYEKDAKPRFEKVGDKWVVDPMESSSSALVAAGAFFLWFGWYGFNCGSTYAIVGKANIAGRVAINTTLAPAAGAISMVFIGRAVSFREAKEQQQFSLSDAINGALAGLVAVTAGCAVLQPWGAIIAGAVAGLVSKFVSELLLWLRIDDPVDAVAVHLGSGSWGIIVSALLAWRDNVLEVYGDDRHWGLFNGGGYRRIIVHTLDIFVIVVWVLLWVVPLLSIMFGIDAITSKYLKFQFLIIRSRQSEILGFGVPGTTQASSTFINPSNLDLNAEELEDMKKSRDGESTDRDSESD